MKFLIDAQLPYLLADVLIQKGFFATHTENLPNKQSTTNKDILDFAASNSLIIITKDLDFLDSFILNNNPKKLLLVTTGNIKNRKLLDLFRLNIKTITELFEHNNLLELNNDQIIVHY
jgi:predicted nuclease of predicted toxin-antitoxin system